MIGQLTVYIPAVDNISDMLYAVIMQVEMRCEDSGRIAVIAPLQGVGKVRNSIVFQYDGHRPVLGAYQRPRFQLGHDVIRQVDERQ